jgi:hypothetical protein
MFAKIKSRIAFAVGAGLLALTLGLSMGGGGSAEAAPPRQPLGIDGGSCFLAGVWYPEGTTMFFNGVTHICKDGSWVIYVRPLRAATQGSFSIQSQTFDVAR